MQFPAVTAGDVRQLFDSLVSRVWADPEILVVVLGSVALLVGLLGLLWWLRRPAGWRFKRALSGRDEVAVLMHPNPDPDAMASALAVAHVADAVGTTATIQYPGQIRHQENRAFRTVLDLDAEQIESAEDVAADDVALVDHGSPRGFEGADQVDPYVVVDHHPDEGEGWAFSDVRPEYGACSTIVAEYLEDLGARPDGGDHSLPWEVATGLLYGIQSDTKHLTSGCTPAEFAASAYLYPAIDEDALDRIANPQVSPEVLAVKARAFRNREVRGPFAVSDVGELSNVDALPQAADELVNLEGVTAVVVLGNRDGELHMSARSRDDRVHMGRALRAAVDDVPQASAGGHARMAGGQIGIEHMQGLLSEGVSRREVVDDLFDAMSGDV